MGLKAVMIVSARLAPLLLLVEYWGEGRTL